MPVLLRIYWFSVLWGEYGLRQRKKVGLILWPVDVFGGYSTSGFVAKSIESVPIGLKEVSLVRCSIDLLPLWDSGARCDEDLDSDQQ